MVGGIPKTSRTSYLFEYLRLNTTDGAPLFRTFSGETEKAEPSGVEPSDT
jgi:hypothetical protein